MGKVYILRSPISYTCQKLWKLADVDKVIAKISRLTFLAHRVCVGLSAYVYMLSCIYAERARPTVYWARTSVCLCVRQISCEFCDTSHIWEATTANGNEDIPSLSATELWWLKVGLLFNDVDIVGLGVFASLGVYNQNTVVDGVTVKTASEI